MNIRRPLGGLPARANANSEQQFSLGYDLDPLPDGMSRMEAESLAKPSITFFANASPESEQAFHAIEAAHLGVHVVAALESAHPWIEWGGNMFEGIERIEGLLAALGAMKAQVLSDLAKQESVAPLHRDASLGRWMSEMYLRQMRVARAEMARILPNGQHRIHA